MELRQLKYFSAVAEQLSFTNAAAKLFVSQSAVSQQISALEAELGVQLLMRDKHAVSLTQAGAEFYQNLQSILSSLDGAVEAAQVTDRARHYAARMTIGIQVSINISQSLTPLLRALEATQDEFPFLIIDVVQVPFDQVEPVLLSGQADAVISLNPAGKKAPFSKGIRFQTLFEEYLMLSIAKRRLAADYGGSQPEVRELLTRYPLNVVNGDSGLIEQIFMIYRHYGLLPKLNYYTNDLQPMLRTRLGHGMSLTPATLMHDADNDEFLEFFDLDTDNARVTRNLLWHADNVSAPLAFLLGQLFSEA